MIVTCAFPMECALTIPSLATDAIEESLVVHNSGWPAMSRPAESSMRTERSRVWPGGIVGCAGEMIIHLASDCGELVEADGSVIAEQATTVAQLASASAWREIDISQSPYRLFGQPDRRNVPGGTP
ncbi:MAG: hypothetical protein ABI186_09400 [Candidatus Elarobacter sp.]